MTAPSPINHQFVAVWQTAEGLPFSATLRYRDGLLESYNYAVDSWESECDHGFSAAFLKSVNATFIREGYASVSCNHDYDVYSDGVENNKCFKCGAFK